MTPADSLHALYARLSAHPLVRRAAWLGFLSWVVALTLTGYLFGFGEGFFGHWFSATLVLWLLAVGTTLGIVPLIEWLTRRLADQRNQPSRSRRPAPPKRAPNRPTNRPSGPPSSIPANKWR